MSTDNHTRRAFLAKLTAAAAGGLLASGSRKAFASTAPEPHITFPTAPRDRISVASYPFRAYIESPTNRDRDPKLPGMDLKDFPAEVVRKFNVRNIEPHSRHFPSLDTAYLSSFREELVKANVKVVNIAVDGQDSYYDADPATRRKAIAYGKKFVDVPFKSARPVFACTSIERRIQGRTCRARQKVFVRWSIMRLAKMFS